MTPTDLLQSALQAADIAAKIQLDFLNRDYAIDYKNNEPRNLVTEADKAVEAAIIAHINKHHPDHHILGEESGENLSQTSTTDSYRWIVDPIDGTNNFSHKHPFFAVSIGIEKNNQVIAGVVKAPLLNETYTATLGQGAFLNNNPIQVSKAPSLEKALVATGFPPKNREENLKYFTKILPEAQGIRRCGAASIDLCYIACGRLDGFWEFGLYPWDIAAASLIITESGGHFSNLTDNSQDLHSRNILATNGIIHEEMRKALNK